MADVQDAGVAVPGGAAGSHPLQIEMNGINVITDSQRKGRPRDLFWPWFAANVSVLGLSYGSFVLGFGISFWQALWVPKGTPKEIIAKLNAAARAAVESDTVKKRFADLSTVAPDANEHAPEVLQQLVSRDVEKYRKLLATPQ